jgi:hypothetical protein
MVSSTGTASLGVSALSPVPTDVFAVAAGGVHSLLLRDLSVEMPPIFTVTPVSGLMSLGSTVTLRASATHVAYYRWFRAGIEIDHASGPTLQFTADFPSAEANYEVHAVNVANETAVASFTLRYKEAYSVWCLRHFSAAELTSPEVVAPLVVLGPDSTPNLLKYALGVAPHDPVASGAWAITQDSTNYHFIYERPASRADLRYEVQTSTDLANWTTDGVTHLRVSTSAEDGRETWSGDVENQAPARFFRLVISSQ